MMLQGIVDSYLAQYPAEAADLSILTEQVAKGDDLQNRSTEPGHVTGSAFVLSPDRSKLLMIHHVFLQKWLQPGGHWEPGEANPLEAARREAEEETNVLIAKNLTMLATDPLVPFDIDTHDIPANDAKGEPAHYHHDFRYVFVAEREELSHQVDEVTQAAWFAFGAPECEHVRQAIHKMKTLGFIEA